MKIPEIGELQPYGELWLLTYDGCGHEQFFFRNQWNYDDAKVLAQVREYYGHCARCLQLERSRNCDSSASLKRTE